MQLNLLQLFQGLETLNFLSLQHCNISQIEDNTLGNLNNLERLRLKENALVVQCPGMFYGLNSLKLLYLYDNRLTRVSADVFNHLPRPLELSLYNRFRNQQKHAELLVFNSSLCWLKQEEQKGNITWDSPGYGGFPPKFINGLDFDNWE